MNAVHTYNIIHLDLKPENVLMEDEHSLIPWVTDFGLAASGLSNSFSNSAAGRGTLKYKAPELFRTTKQGGALLIPAADIYSFGILAWEVLTGAVPWADQVDTEIMMSVVNGERPELSDCKNWRAAKDPGVVALIDECLHQDPGDRPSFAAIATRL